MRWRIWRLKRKRWERRHTPPWSRTALCHLMRPATPCLKARERAHPPRVVRRRRRRRMNTPPLATHARTGTCTHLTTATQAAPTAPMGTSHRTGCCNTKLSKATSRGPAGSAAAPGPVTPTELKLPDHTTLPSYKQISSFRSTLIPDYLNLRGLNTPPLPPHTNIYTHTHPHPHTHTHKQGYSLLQ